MPNENCELGEIIHKIPPNTPYSCIGILVVVVVMILILACSLTLFFIS
ncbi:MAG: hypothetical protein LBR15_04755 [Methanobrevibacter sp.]|jgi:hypothetical protein|nr:hypothetical protein [Candidatus Methanovirga australis]